MAYINDQVYLNGLNWAVANATTLRLCSQEPVDFAESSTYGLAGSPITLGTPQNGAIDGMRTIIPTIIGGSVTAAGRATHWAVTDGAGILVATGSLNTPLDLLVNTLFNLTETIDITLRDAV